jgi:hypothetical protein
VGKQNLVYATVMHETNRENEPQIHSHNVIVSAVYDETDQKWRSLTNDQMLKLRAKADVIYKAELAQGLKRAGYELEYADNGVDFEIKGFSPEHIELYATRKNQIKAALLARGIEPGSASFDARQTAALDSRSRKQELPRDALQQIWQDAGRDAGLSVASIVSRARERAKGVEQAVQTRERADRLPGNAGARQVDAVAQKAAVRAVSWAVEHLSEREQAFSLVDVELAAVKFSRGGIDDVDWAIQQHIKNHLLVARGTDTDGAMMYTTHRAIETEMRLSEHIRAGMGENRVVLTGQAEFDAAVQTFEARKGAELGAPFKLSGEQLEAARNLLMHPDSFQGVQGDAGTGKTAALEMVNDVAKARGWRVSGVATSAAAAKQLEGDSGIESDTVAGYLSKRDNRIKATELRLAELRSAMTSQDRKCPLGNPPLGGRSRGRAVWYPPLHVRSPAWRSLPIPRQFCDHHRCRVDRCGKPSPRRRGCRTRNGYDARRATSRSRLWLGGERFGLSGAAYGVVRAGRYRGSGGGTDHALPHAKREDGFAARDRC